MTAGLPHRPHGPPSAAISSSNRPSTGNPVSRTWFQHSSAQRISTDTIIVQAIRAEYPQLHLTVVPKYNCNIVSWANAGFAGLAPIDKEDERLRWRNFIPSATRTGGTRGFLAEEILCGKFLLDWRGKEYIVYIIDGRDGMEPYPHVTNQYILSPSIEASNRLLMEAGVWTNELHEEIWVYDQGYWQKSRELFQSIKKASWDDVILAESMKKSLISDVVNFFDSHETYEKLGVPWKRGIIYYGPPGNGKTISIKAMMSMLYKRKDPIPTLYVKTLTNFFGPEASINDIFNMARRTAPCYLVFEDLDSIVQDSVRSFFLNAVDGIQKNDGILMVGSTNHLDRLDPGIAKRPSRFDRKYLFPNPSFAERTQYMKFWQHKLSDQDEVEMPDKMCPAIAKITKGFSFAYLQEAMIASLLVIARDADDEVDADVSEEEDEAQGEGQSPTCLECMDAHPRPDNGSSCDRETARPFKGLYDWIWTVRRADEEDPDLDHYILWREVKKQVRILREEMDSEKVKN